MAFQGTLRKSRLDHATPRETSGLKATDGTEPLSIRCVRETLRLRQSEYIYRKVLDDIPVEDFVIPKGWLLRVCVRESHRDPLLFENPNGFNPDRFIARRYSRAEYSTFGASRVSCLGEHLTLTWRRSSPRNWPSTSRFRHLKTDRWSIGTGTGSQVQSGRYRCRGVIDSRVQ